MTNKHLEYLVGKVRNELRERSIPILCEAYNGQWHKFVMEDENAQPLTKLHGRDNWNRVASMSKDKCVNEIAMVSVVKRSTHEIIKHHQMDKGSEINIHEIQISKGLNSDLHVSSAKGVMKHLHSVHPISRPDLFTRTLINNNTHIKETSVVIEEEKYICKEDGFKVKRKRKYMCTSIFQTNDVEKKSE